MKRLNRNLNLHLFQYQVSLLSHPKFLHPPRSWPKRLLLPRSQQLQWHQLLCQHFQFLNHNHSLSLKLTLTNRQNKCLKSKWVAHLVTCSVEELKKAKKLKRQLISLKQRDRQPNKLSKSMSNSNKTLRTNKPMNKPKKRKKCKTNRRKRLI